MSLQHVFGPLKDELTPENMASLIIAYILSDVVVNPDGPIMFSDTNLGKIDTDMFLNG